ncbi:MAG TPA: hypothetical protein VJ965_04815 [Anaerolineales bacterium]|nr:hypothetical protein [Anaerolineales bacterium]
MPVESRFVQVAEKAPAFTLPTVNGEVVSIEQVQADRHVVLVFLRGVF